MRSAERCRAPRKPAVLGALAGWALLALTIVPAHAGAAPACSGSSSTVFGFGGAKVVSDTNVAVCATGRVEVSFGSAAAPGCTAGPCGYTGAEVWQPTGGGDLDVAAYRLHGRRRFSATLLLGDSNTVSSAVERAHPNGQTTACSDTNNGQAGGVGFLTSAVRGGRLAISLARDAASLFGTRCAGPLAVDFGAALPRSTISLRRIGRRVVVVDLRGTRSFAAHGFSGVVRSTLVLRLGLARRTQPAPRPPSTLTHGRRFRNVNVTYRVERLQGSAVAQVGTLPDLGECGPFDACGLSGEITIAPGAARGGSFTLSAGASVSRPRRDLLAALGLSARGNPAAIGVFGGGEERLRGTVTADLQQDGACRDQTQLALASLQMQSHAGRVLVSLSPQASQAPDPLRTRCPGPQLGQHALALAMVSRDALRRRALTVRLRGNAYADGPYRVTTHSTLVLSLRRVRVQSQVFTEPTAP